MNSPKVVAMGGGHGLAVTLTALRALTTEITAVVTVADNGGSSGRLRQEFNSLPPGDLRMALAALCGDDSWGRGWAEIMQYRFSSEGEMSGHAIGNLLLTALWDRDGDPVRGLDRVGELLKVIGRVLPMAIEPLDIEGTFATSYGRTIVRGQVEVATAKGRVESLRLIPAAPRATPQALSAIMAADWLTFGPGSWFSSVMPHFLLAEQADAIRKSRARKIFILNLAEGDTGFEFAGYSPEEHLELVLSHVPDLAIDFAIADPAVIRPNSTLEALVRKCGGELIICDLAESPGSFHHDPKKLTSAFAHIFSSTLLR
ncbi:MAG: uridine diphosphate-N-acetylglucosamine-binding protein YvcK [Actinomycetes bacterium]